MASLYWEKHHFPSNSHVALMCPMAVTQMYFGKIRFFFFTKEEIFSFQGYVKTGQMETQIRQKPPLQYVKSLIYQLSKLKNRNASKRRKKNCRRRGSGCGEKLRLNPYVLSRHIQNQTYSQTSSYTICYIYSIFYLIYPNCCFCHFHPTNLGKISLWISGVF